MASPESKRRERVEPTVELVKEAPPPSRREHGLLVRCADQFDALRADPGEWYRLLDYGVQKSALSGAGYLRKKTTGFEFTARGGCVYARYVDEAAS